jgi:hypothetical protein
MASACLDLLESEGTAVIDGGLAAQPLLPRLVAALRPGSRILVEAAGDGTAAGAALLRDHGSRRAPVPLTLTPAPPLELPNLAAHQSRWRAAAASAGP